MKVVTIVQRRLTHYRLPLFERMRSTLAAQGVTLRLLHGQPSPHEVSKGDEGTLPWAEPLNTRYVANGRLCWQPFMSSAKGSDLIIVTQENKLLNNLLALTNPARQFRLAFWGHGRNLQAKRPDGLAERFKRWTTNRVDWWFAYTDMTARFLHEDGFPLDRVTVLNNSIDTNELRLTIADAKRSSPTALRAALALPTAGPLGVFLGSLYGEKRIPWLLNAASLIRERVPDFHLAIAGEGEDRQLVEDAARSTSHVHYLGSVRGTRKAQLLAASDIMLNPGLVGLGILDAFVAGLPILTTDCGLHSPEIAYLTQGVNGLMTTNETAPFVDAAFALVSNPARVKELRQGALAAGNLYSVENMSDRFCSGIQAALE